MIGAPTADRIRFQCSLALIKHFITTYIQVTRTLVYHRRNPPLNLAFPAGVNGIIRGTPGSTGACIRPLQSCV